MVKVEPRMQEVERGRNGEGTLGYKDEKRKRRLWGRQDDLRWKRLDPFKCYWEGAREGVGKALVENYRANL